MLEFKTISRIARVLMDMNQTQLSVALGLDIGTVSAWERGISMPTERHRKAFEALCVKRNVGFAKNGMPVLMDSDWLRMIEQSGERVA